MHQALRQAARWYRRYFEAPETMRQFSLEQIRDYEATYATAQNLPVAPVMADLAPATEPSLLS